MVASRTCYRKVVNSCEKYLTLRIYSDVLRSNGNGNDKIRFIFINMVFAVNFSKEWNECFVF